MRAESSQRIQQAFTQRVRLRKRGLLTPAHEIEHLDKASFKLIKRDSPQSDYPAILDALRDGFPAHRSSLLCTKPCSPQTTNRGLCRCLNIPEQTPNGSHRVNASQATTPVPAELLQRLGRHFCLLVTAAQERCPDLMVEQH